MNTEKTGTMIARAAGLVLVITGASSLLYLLPWFQPPGMASSGWTSYSPTSATPPAQDLMTQLHDTYYVVAGTASFYIPSAGQALAGVVMIMLSRQIGRWLARGLSDTDTHDAA